MTIIDSTKEFFQDVWANKTKRYIAIGIGAGVLLILLIIIIAAASSGSKSKGGNDNSDSFKIEYVKPDCTGYCSKPYNIEVYSDKTISSKLIQCGYQKNSNLLNFVVEAVKTHNILRACHNAQPLLPNCEIMKISQDYAKTMPSGHSGTQFHGDWMGENLYWSTGKSLNGADPINLWYSEIDNYNFNTHTSKGGMIGHFTQVVWKNSKEIGIGYYCSGSSCCVVGNYYPAGNVGGYYPQNVQNIQ